MFGYYDIAEKVRLSNGWTFNVCYDTIEESPFEMFDRIGTILTTDNRYWTGDEVIGCDIDDYDVEEFLKSVKDNGGIVLPICAYIHSGVTVWHSDFEGRAVDSWDSGVIGFSYITAETIQKEYGAVNDETRQKAAKALDSELKAIDTIMNAPAYGLVLEDDRYNTIDSIWGLYGYDSIADMVEYHIHDFDIPKNILTELLDKIHDL